MSHASIIKTRQEIEQHVPSLAARAPAAAHVYRQSIESTDHISDTVSQRFYILQSRIKR